MKYTGIILAAGRGSRTSNFTPKSLLKHNSKFLITNIINNFKKNRINNIILITGYRNHLFDRFKLPKLINQKWKFTNMVQSLMSADYVLSNHNCIVSYADIFYEQNAINSIICNNDDIAITSYNNWKSLWEKRFSNPLDDLETFKYNSKSNYLYEIGKKPKNFNEINGQFMGLLKFSKKGWSKFKYAILKKNYCNQKKIDITTNLNNVIKHNQSLIKVVEYKGKFFEIDTKEDIKKFL